MQLYRTSPLLGKRIRVQPSSKPNTGSNKEQQCRLRKLRALEVVGFAPNSYHHHWHAPSAMTGATRLMAYEALAPSGTW